MTDAFLSFYFLCNKIHCLYNIYIYIHLCTFMYIYTHRHPFSPMEKDSRDIMVMIESYSFMETHSTLFLQVSSFPPLIYDGLLPLGKEEHRFIDTSLCIILPRRILL